MPFPFLSSIRVRPVYAGRSHLLLLCAVLFASLDSVQGVSRVFPEVRLRTPEGEVFSPNGDGVKDMLRVDMDLKEGKGVEIVDWELQIAGSQGLVRSFLPDRRVRRGSALFGSAGTAAHLPEFLLWDGRDETGRIVADGRYRMELVVTHSYNRIERRYGREVIVDTSLPSVALKVLKPHVLRRAGADGRLAPPEGEITIEQTPVSEAGLQFTGHIIDASGAVVESRHWKDALPGKIAWNGRQIGGEPALPGVYRYELEWSDAAGNRRTMHAFQLQVLSMPSSASLHSESFFVDRNGRSLRPLSNVSIQHTAKERPLFLKLERLESSALRSREWKEVSRFRTNPVMNLAAEQDLFRALPESGLVRLTGEDVQGRSVTSPVHFFVELAPPVVSLRIESDRWSPAELPGRSFKIRPQFQSAAPLADWAITCYVDTGRSRTVLREWKGDGRLPIEIPWLGDADGYRLSSGERLYFEFQASTMAGRSSRVTTGPLVIGAHFFPARQRSEDLTGQFALSGLLNGNDLSAEGRALLDETATIVKGLDGYHLRVRAFVSFQGEEDENLLRSERIARLVRDALVQRGIPLSETEFRGEGETGLVSEGDDDFSAHRNNRVLIELRHLRQPRGRP